MSGYDDDLSQEAWDAAEEQHRNRYRIPERLTDDQAKQHFSKISRIALVSFASNYANEKRSKEGLRPIRFVLPPDLARWIEAKIDSVDSVTGHLGRKTYQTIADSLPSKLRAIEHTFLGYHD